MVLVITVWILAAIVVGHLGRYRQGGFLSVFLLALINPLIVLIALPICAGEKNSLRRMARVRMLQLQAPAGEKVPGKMLQARERWVLEWFAQKYRLFIRLPVPAAWISIVVIFGLVFFVADFAWRTSNWFFSGALINAFMQSLNAATLGSFSPTNAIVIAIIPDSFQTLIASTERLFVLTFFVQILINGVRSVKNGRPAPAMSISETKAAAVDEA